MQTLQKIWTFIRKYSGLLIAGLLGILFTVTMNRKSTQPVTVPKDTNANGRDDEEEIQIIKTDAQTQREAATTNVEAAKKAVARPVQPKPSRSVHEAVRRNNEVDY